MGPDRGAHPVIQYSFHYENCLPDTDPEHFCAVVYMTLMLRDMV